MGWYMHPNKWDFYSLRVDDTAAADPWHVPHIPDYSRLSPLGKDVDKSDARDRGRRVVWVHEDAALAEVLEKAKQRAQNPRPKKNDSSATGDKKGNEHET